MLLQEIAGKLKVGDWGAVQARDGSSDEHFWIFRAVDAGNGTPIIQKFKDRRGSLADKFGNSTLFTEGDYAIAVEWWDRDPADDTNLTFMPWVPNGATFGKYHCVVNSTEVRSACFQVAQDGTVSSGMRAVEQLPLGIVHRRRPTRTGVDSRYATRREDPMEQRYVLPVEI